ncbi:Crp/Fnr family transcriptional regulator [Fulvivirga lutimaris]|uniref:Crp/Fnr family transcriptional regulator n=1 Tax=Fulvivirga lutimaris TaxID=1819566 RepID=UPI0012BC8DBB|nr:Crp/Fnr family transcriptional regulator [Fulvivirga lutimaris]MTI39832.1 Crp/Fnr family transcriptional regulator [Fulvivirga lutimaris]
MDKSELNNHLLKYGFEPALVQEIYDNGRSKKVVAGEVIVKPGQNNNYVPLVLDGVLKVTRHDDDGSEIFLYYLEGGDTCAMSISCCLDNSKSQISASAEEDSTIWMIPIEYLDSWIAKYQSFRRFIFNSYRERFDEMLLAIDSMAFMKMDERLYKYLLDKKQSSGSFEIKKTHEQIAKELNTSRVVISRLLKQLENEEKIEQSRNKIEIL